MNFFKKKNIQTQHVYIPIYRPSLRVLVLFHQAVLESVLHYWIVAWFGNISAKLNSHINGLVHTAIKVMEYPSLQTLFEKTIVKQARFRIFLIGYRRFCRYWRHVSIFFFYCCCIITLCILVCGSSYVQDKFPEGQIK